MTPPPGVPPEFLDKPLVELLKLIAIGKLTKDTLKEAKKRIKERWETREYGFTPEPELASGLQKTGKSEAFRRMKDCIGNHSYLSLVKLGLRIAELSDNGRVETIAKIKNDVLNKYGMKGVRILNMGSTGVLQGIIRYLSDLKIEQNYNQADMADHFDKIIEKWNERTIFHKSSEGQKELKLRIISYMNTPHELFFVFASGNAGDQAKKAIATLNNKDEIQKRGYRFYLFDRKEDMTGRVLFTWVFEKTS